MLESLSSTPTTEAHSIPQPEKTTHQDCIPRTITQAVSREPIVSLSPQCAEDTWTYLHFELSSELLSAECRRAIEVLGVECLEEGASFEAYGIARVSGPLLDVLGHLKGVIRISHQEPPCSK